MSLFGSLSGGVSGLLGQSEAMSVISDNLSNVNTIGYKNTRTLFDQQVTSAGLSGTLYNSGGVGTSFDRFQSAQGAFLSTQSSTDLALSGNGFFTVVDTNEVSTDTSFFYTRAGAFTEDSRGFLTLASGQHLLGWRTESDGAIQNIQNPQPVELQSVGASARATSSLDIGLNLTASEDIHDYDTAAPASLVSNISDVIADPKLADYVTDVRFFDSEGGPRDVSFVFTKRANNLWDWAAYTDGGEVVTDLFGNPVAEGTNAAIGQGTLRFNTNGTLKHATGTSLDIDWSGGVENGSVELNLGEYTGGFIFDEATATGSMSYTDGVLDVAIDENNPDAPSALSGTYTFSNAGPVSGGYQIDVLDPDGNTFSAIVPNNANPRTLEFANGVTLTVGSGFDVTTWTGGTMDVPTTAIAQLEDGRGGDGIIQYTSPYNTAFANQDGFGSGTLSNISVDEDGFVIGSFTNGESKKLWKLVISVFQDPAELEPVGNNLLRETDGSGRPLRKEAGVGGTAQVVSGALEQSTVDIAQEFSNMIVSQRAFQASSTIISTVDQMLNELLQIR